MSKINNFLKGVLLGTLIVVLLCSCGKGTASYLTESQTSEDNDEMKVSEETEDSQKQENSEVKMLYIYVCGCVNKPGVYTLPEGSRVFDLFTLAGGLTEDAAMDYWNQARLLTDGEMIYVPSKDEAKNHTQDGESSNKMENDKSNKVNINTAKKEELMTLPGIGETKALAIIAYRQENGPFSSVEELKEVEGIKEAVFSKVKDLIEI